MKTVRRTLCIAVLVTLSGLFLASSVSAQVLATGETGGKGNHAVLLSANAIVPDGLSLLNVFGQYIYGVTDRLDVGPVYGNVSALGRTQHYVGVSWNLNLLRRSQTFVDVSFFGVVTVPLNKRGEASTVFTAPAIIVSRPVNIKGRPINLYSGFNTNAPISQRADKLFTPPETVWNIPVGLSVAVSGKWMICAEVDIHNNVNAFGAGLIRTF